MLVVKTKRRTTTNLKTKNNQNCQKIKLYGSLTTKELKKKLSRLVGGAEGKRVKVAAAGPGHLGRRGSGWQSGWSHICVRMNWEEPLGSETDCTTQGSSVGK